ncbi:MAG: FecR domain-containing protein [Pseudomonadota bacterium]|nr:FecR domain-containing protein [Pseudomonadota bacterium]
MRRQIKFASALKLTTALVALSAAPFAANAAECFDEDTSNPKAGAATAVVGPDVGLKQGGGDYERPAAGDDVFSEDYARTGADSHLQLKLCDWSTYTLSPESEAQISEFYDDEGARRRRLVNYVRGGFRYASGRDTESGSTDVEIQESGVTMGVRGTNVILVELDGVVYALLEGPALDNNGLTPQGRVEFWTGDNRRAIEAKLMRPGWAVRIGPDGVSEPFRADPELLRRIYQAFLPGVPDETPDNPEYESDPEDDSGQGGQNGQWGIEVANNYGQQNNDNTENFPEQPFQAGEPPEEPETPPFPVNVGDVLPLDALEYYAENFAPASGHIFALAPAQLFVDDGSGATLVDEGVVLIQINIDSASHTIAPEALASFVKFDFSILDPGNLGTDDNDFFLGGTVPAAYVQALLASANIAFPSGQNGLAMFPTQAFAVTIRQGAGNTVTVDVAVDFTALDPQHGSVNALAEALNLQLMPGAGELAYFDFGLSDVFTIDDLTAHQTSGTVKISGFTPNVAQTTGQIGPVTGLAYAQLEVNFNNKTVGGPGSFMVMTAAASAATGNQQANAFISLDQPVAFGSGLFNMALYPLSGLTNSGALVAGQALVVEGSDVPVYADIAAILTADTGAHLYAEVLAGDEFFGANYAPSTIAELDSLGAMLGTGAFYFDGGGASVNSAFLSNPVDGDSFGNMYGQIDINFGDRTIGGGESFISADLFNFNTSSTFQFTEYLSETSFNSALGGQGVFAFDGGDFDGNNIQSLIFIIRNDLAGNAAQSADAFMNFTDGAGGKGVGELREMVFSPGSACTVSCF